MAAPKASRYRQWISYQALLLGGFSTLATALLVAGNLATRDAIQARHRDDLLASLGQAIPATVHDNDLLEDPLILTGPGGKPLTVYRGTRQSAVSALAWEISGRGYAGEIRLLLGLDTRGRILGVRVLSHAETPGLGDRIEAQKDDWILKFDGLSLGNPPLSQWKVKKDGGRFDAFSGATITPRAVVQTITAGLEFFARHQPELLAPPAAIASKQESPQ